ncbi:hypothetical protein ACFLQR_00695 [Verrucomicrobiota bacterium]
MNQKNQSREIPSCHAVVRAWFCLTSQERMSLFVVLGLVILGLAARYWHLRHEKAETYHGPPNTEHLTPNP